MNKEESKELLLETIRCLHHFLVRTSFNDLRYTTCIYSCSKYNSLVRYSLIIYSIYQFDGWVKSALASRESFSEQL